MWNCAPGAHARGQLFIVCGVVVHAALFYEYLRKPSGFEDGNLFNQGQLPSI
jgi:hypothetical protein